MPRASLVVPSIHRTEEVIRLFESLSQQSCQDFEVIVVDQNPDDRLVPIIHQYSPKTPVKHLRSQPIGASRARNLGLSHAGGDIIFWPDDDSWLPGELVGNVVRLFDAQPSLSAAIGILVDGTGKPHQRWAPASEQQAGFMDALIRAAEPVLFFRREVVTALQGFDPSLGTGAQTPWGAGEGTDLCIRALKAGFDIKMEPSLTVYHANINIKPDDPHALIKVRSYARGMGAVLKKNRLPLVIVLRYAFTYPRALLWNIIRGRWSNARYHWIRLMGLMAGVKSYSVRPEQTQQ